MVGEGKVVVVGLDGASFDVLDPYLENGTMPNLARLKENGVWGELESVIPPNSAPAWASFATGKNPGKHGIFEFRARIPGDLFRKVVVNSRSMQGETLWNMLSRHGKRVGVFNVPMTYPAQPLNGFMVTGMLTPVPGPAMTYPESLYEELTRVVDKYVIDTPWGYYNHQPGRLLDALLQMTRLRTKVLQYLLDRFSVDALIVVFIATDRLQHALWSLIDPEHPAYDPQEAKKWAGPIARIFAALDDAIGSIIDYAGSEADLFVISDHGFQASKKQLSLDDWLTKNGFLALDQRRQWFIHNLKKTYRTLAAPLIKEIGPRRISNITGRVKVLSDASAIDWQRTKAYCSWDLQQGISINLKGREPLGIVEPGAEYESLRTSIAEALLSLQDPSLGEPVINRVLRREEYYRGPFLEMAPDLLVIPNEGYAVAPRKKRMFEPTGWASGEHSMQGILIASGQHLRSGNDQIIGAQLIDIAPTVLYTMGLPIAADMDGRVLTDLFEPAFVVQSGPCYEALSGSTSEARELPWGYSEDEDRKIQDRLKGLGYL